MAGKQVGSQSCHLRRRLATSRATDIVQVRLAGRRVLLDAARVKCVPADHGSQVLVLRAHGVTANGAMQIVRVIVHHHP